MRLVYVIDSLVPSGGAEQALSQMAPVWRAAGHDVSIVSLSKRSGLQAKLRREGLQVFELGVNRLAAVRELVRLFRALDPDLVHTTLFEADLAGRTAAAVTRTPAVTSLVNVAYGPEHRGDPSLSVRRLAAAQVCDAVSARAARRFHAITHHVADVMRPRLALGSKPIDVVPRGRDPQVLGERTRDRRQRIRQQLGTDDHTPVLVVAARHEHQKGLDILLSAMARMEEPVHLWVAGREGTATPALRRQSASAGLDGRVTWLGIRDDVPDLMAAADVVVVPSRWEGLGSTVIEAMGIGTPLVASDVPAVRETLGGPEFGFLVQPDDPAALAAVLPIALAPDADALARRARGRFQDHYTLEAVAKRMTAFHERAIAS